MQIIKVWHQNRENEFFLFLNIWMIITAWARRVYPIFQLLYSFYRVSFSARKISVAPKHPLSVDFVVLLFVHALHEYFQLFFRNVGRRVYTDCIRKYNQGSGKAMPGVDVFHL